MNGLKLHCGTCISNLDEIECIQTPEPSGTHFPISHGSLIRNVREQLLDNGIAIREEEYGLTHDGARVFGVMALEASHLLAAQGSDLVLGIRNSHDKSFSAGLALGNRVFVCDNLSFYGTRTLARKHTRFAERDLPGLIARILGKLGDWAARQAETIQIYERIDLSDEQAHDFMIRAVQTGVICSSKLPPVIEAWHREDQPKNLWGLFNDFTGALRGNVEIPTLARRTERLHGLADLQVARLRQLPATHLN